MQTASPFNNPITELRDYLREFAAECRVSRWFRPALHVRVVDQIAADVEANREAIEKQAHASEIADLEADRLIDEVLADGVVEPHELPKLRAARAHIRNSATADQQIGQLARA